MHSQVDLTEDVKNVLPVANGGAGGGVNHQTGTSYSVTSGDNRMLVVLDNASAVAVTLPDPAALPAGFACHVANIGAGLATLTPAAGTVDGAASLSLAQDQGAMLFSDGADYFTERGIGGSGGGSVYIDGSSISNPNFNDSTPAAPPGKSNVKFQKSGSNVSAYADGGAWTLIQTTILSSATGSISFSSIPGAYRQLAIIGTVRVDDSGTTQPVVMQLNGDTGSNYDWAQFQNTNTSSYVAQTFIKLLGCPASGASSNLAGSFRCILPGYAGTTFFKACLTDFIGFATLGSTSTYYFGSTSGVWRSASAVTSIAISDGGGGNMISGSSFSLYGIS